MIRRGRTIAMLALVTVACTTNRAVELSAGPESIRQYLDAQHPSDIQVTDSVGKIAWLHGPHIEGELVTGTLSRDEPRERRAVPLTSIRSIAVPHFSTGRTIGLVGGIIGSASVGLLILVSAGGEAVY